MMTTRPAAEGATGVAFGLLAIAFGLLASLGVASGAHAASLTVSGATFTRQASPSSCTYTQMSEDSAGNWSVTCGSGTRTISISPAVNGTVCESYESMAEDANGNWTVSGCVSLDPQVSLDAPATSGGSYAANQPFELLATAGVPQGRTVGSVEFLDNGVLIHAAVPRGSQYAWDWMPPSGTHVITVRVTDNTQAVAQSPARTMVMAAGELYYIHPDHLGTPRAITRESDNQVVWRWDNTEPFGNSAPNENPSSLGVFAYNLRFPGQYFDVETGTHYNYFRDYDPAIGRYIESDPIGLGGGTNTYAYVSGNPVRFIDPRGLQAFPRPRPPIPIPSPGAGGASGGDVIPFPPGGRDRERPGRDRPDSCPAPTPDNDRPCTFTGLATLEQTEPYAYILSCQYRCPRKGIKYLETRISFPSLNPAFLCSPSEPESIFSWSGRY
jgi:RHS repeat-associated protein